MAVLLAKRALPRSLDAPPPAVAEDLALLPNSFGQQALDGDASRSTSRSWPSRLARGGCAPATGGRSSSRRATTSSSPRSGCARTSTSASTACGWRAEGEGVAVIETAAPAGRRTGGARTHGNQHDSARGIRSRVEQNPLSPFDDAMLRRIDGVDEEVLAFLRSLPATIDAAGAYSRERFADVDLAFLLADIWERPRHHCRSSPTAASRRSRRSRSRRRSCARGSCAPTNETELVAATTSAQIRKLLDRSIEEWMVYLHPSQRAIANANFNGPARVRGGPGTGKTVVALHRARVLARKRVEGPTRCCSRRSSARCRRCGRRSWGCSTQRRSRAWTIRNIDALARELVAAAHGGSIAIVDAAGRQKLVEPLLKRHGLEAWMADNPQMLLDEFDAFLAGRGIERLEDYLALRRRGGGSATRTGGPRAGVRGVHGVPRSAAQARRACDWPHIRLEALRLAEAGAGPRYNGVIVDEAQDLSAVGMRLLLALDASENHRHFLIVGDGQQSIYPGGFALREIGVDIVGRSRVLTANWRNTWSVWTAARAVIEGQEFDDLDEDVGLRPTGEEPEPLTVGDPAELHVLRSPAEELELLAALVGSGSSRHRPRRHRRARRGQPQGRGRRCARSTAAGIPTATARAIRGRARRRRARRHLQSREGPRVQGGLRSRARRGGVAVALVRAA